MKMIIAFAAGALIGAALTVLIARPASSGRERGRDSVWRERAERTESELAAAERQRDALAGELKQLTERFSTLAGRFETLSAAASAQPTPTAATGE
jgi:hypothetical protein